MKAFLYCALAALVVFGVIVHLVYYPHLPDQVASHFNAAGQADGFMSKSNYFAMMICLTVGMPAFLAALAWGIKYMPASMVNVPHKEYWLSPSMRPYTDALNEKILLWVALSTSAFLAVLGHLTNRANCRNEDLPTVLFAAVLLAYLAVVLGVAFGTYYKMLRIPKPEDSQIE